jgi:hypothetical protein
MKEDFLGGGKYNFVAAAFPIQGGVFVIRLVLLRDRIPEEGVEIGILQLRLQGIVFG